MSAFDRQVRDSEPYQRATELVYTQALPPKVQRDIAVKVLACLLGQVTGYTPDMRLLTPWEIQMAAYYLLNLAWMQEGLMGNG